MADEDTDDTLDPKLDENLPDKYRDLMKQHARNFDERRPNADSATAVRWDFYGGGTRGNFDAAESIFVARQLEYLRPGVYAKKYPKLKWSLLIPANYDVDTGAESYTVQGSDVAGTVQITKLPANNTNMVSMKVFEGSMGFFSMQLGYQYNVQEARNAIFARRPLSPALAMACRNIMERKLDDIAFLGESVTAIKGLLTLSGTETYSTPATGTGGLTTWESKASDDILLDLNAPLDQVVVNSNEIEECDAMLLPTSRRRLISNRRVGDGTSMTVLKYFFENQEQIKAIDTTYKSESNSNWTGKRGMAYTRDREHLEMVIPQPFEQFQPIIDGVTITTQCHMRTGGVALLVPKSVIYFDNI